MIQSRQRPRWLSLLYGGNAGFVRPKSALLLLRAAGREALAAEHRPPRRGLEGDRVGLAALVTGDLKALAVAAGPAPATAPAEIGPARVAARLAALRLAQISFRVIFLL